MVTTDDHPGEAPWPAIEMLIPSTWDFKGAVHMYGGKTGCFSESFFRALGGQRATMASPNSRAFPTTPGNTPTTRKSCTTSPIPTGARIRE